MISYAGYFENLTRQATNLSGYTDYFNNPQAGMTQIPDFPYLDVNSYYDAYLNALQQSVEPIPAITPTPITPPPTLADVVTLTPDQTAVTRLPERSDPEIQTVINNQLLTDIGATPGQTNPANPEVRRRRGRRSTILTSQLGLGGGDSINRPSARLLG